MIGIDLGGTNIRGALVSPDGRITRSLRIVTRMNLGVESLLERLEKLCRQLSENGSPCAAVGIGIPGILDINGAIRVSPNLPELNGVHLARLLGARLGCPVVAVNDADAIAWGEARYGAGEDLPSFIAVTLGTGVGGGLVLNRSLWRGRNGASCEIGHLTVEPEGRLCGCGNRGCLETYASATGIVRSVKEALARGEASTLDRLATDELTALAVATAARSGDVVALTAIELAAGKLGQALAAVINLLNLDGVVICGGVSNSFAQMHPILEHELQTRSFVYAWRKPFLLQGTLGDDAGILGAAELAGRALAFGGETTHSRVSFNSRFHERPMALNRHQRIAPPDELKAKELYRLISYPSPEEVQDEVLELLADLLSAADLTLLKQCYAEALALYRGEWPGFQACNTEYHNLYHVIHTYLALTRIVHGGALDHEKFSSREITIALCVAIFHDSGYLQEIGDIGTGAKYTREHVARGIRLFRNLAPSWGLNDAELDTAEHLFYATDLATAYRDIPFATERYRLLGQLLDASDLMTQMSDRAYLEKLLFLYHEFREAGIDFYQNEADLLRKTIDFYQIIDQRLGETSPLVDLLLRTHFRYRNGLAVNPYQESIRRQRTYLEQVLQKPDAEPLEFLKRSGIVEKIRQRYP